MSEADLAEATRRHGPRRTFGLAALGLTVSLGTALMAVGSCDEGATGRVETTAAVTTVSLRTVSSLPAPATTPAATATDEGIPPITFSPPLSPPPRRRSPAKVPKAPAAPSPRPPR